MDGVEASAIGILRRAVDLDSDGNRLDEATTLYQEGTDLLLQLYKGWHVLIFFFLNGKIFLGYYLIFFIINLYQTDRHVCFKYDIIPKTEGGHIHLNSMTV